MYISKDGTPLYLRPWDFNSRRIMLELARIVEEHGGRVKYRDKYAMIRDRNYPDVAVRDNLGGYISFVLDDLYFYHQHDDNPFFPFYYQKTPIRDGKYSGDACLDELPKTWLYDCFLGSNCPDEYIQQGAEMVFGLLREAEMSVIRPDYKMVSVSNLYDGGYHQEKILNERIRILDF